LASLLSGTRMPEMSAAGEACVDIVMDVLRGDLLTYPG
jgi:hypothetical protein